MLRMCGATTERDARTARLCWCGGLFCGRGGAKATREFIRDARPPVMPNSAAAFDELLRQLSLFDGGAVQDKWNKRIAAHHPVTTARPIKCP